MLVDPPALRAGFLLPAGDGALIEVEGDDNSLHRTAVGKQRHDCEHQPPRLVHPVEGGVFGLGEGPPTAYAAITALFVAMDHEVALSRTTVGAAAPVVTELLVRVHADTHPFFGGQRPKKDAAGPAYSSTQPSSTLPWGATRHLGGREMAKLLRRHPLVTFFLLVFIITWVVWVPRASGAPLGVVGQAWTWAPAIAALLAAALTGGRGALRELGSRLVRWRVGWQWYLVVILGPAAFSLAVAGVY